MYCVWIIFITLTAKVTLYIIWLIIIHNLRSFRNLREVNKSGKIINNQIVGGEKILFCNFLCWHWQKAVFLRIYYVCFDQIANLAKSRWLQFVFYSFFKNNLRLQGLVSIKFNNRFYDLKNFIFIKLLWDLKLKTNIRWFSFKFLDTKLETNYFLRWKDPDLKAKVDLKNIVY